MFHSGQLAMYAPLMNDAAEKLATRLRSSSSPAAERTAEQTTDQDPGKAAAVAAGADADATAQQGATGPPSLNISAALGTMTLEVIGTSAFGCAAPAYASACEALFGTLMSQDLSRLPQCEALQEFRPLSNGCAHVCSEADVFPSLQGGVRY